MNQQERDATLNGDYLRVRGYALSPDRRAFRDADGEWWSMNWSHSEGRYVSNAAWVDAVLRVATYGGG